MRAEVIILLVASILLLAYLVYGMIIAFQKRPTLGKPLTIDPISLILFIWGILFAALLLYRGDELGANDLAQILLMIGLVAVTATYAWSTHRQADASEKMAEEMGEERYGAVRPVIDIIKEADGGTRILGEAMEGALGQIPDELLCRIYNIGVGPAMDVVTTVMSFTAGSMKKSFGTMGVGDHTEPYLLSITQEGSRQELCVYYKDIYGNRYRSRREVKITDAGIELGDFEFEPLPRNKEFN